MADSRQNVEERFKWKLEDIYASDREFEDDCIRLDEMMKKIPEIERTLTRDARSLGAALSRIEEMERICNKLYAYAHLRCDEDNSEAHAQAMRAQAARLAVRLSAALSFVNPALLAMSHERLKTYMKAAKAGNLPDGSKRKKKLRKLKELGIGKKAVEGLAPYDFMLAELVRYRPHVLPEPEEKLMALAGDVMTGPKEIFSMLNDVDLRFGRVRNEKGEEVDLTHGSYVLLMRSPDRGVREAAYNALYDKYKDFIHTLGATYGTSVRKDSFVAKAHRFDHAIDRALFSDNVPLALYDNLIGIIHSSLGTMHDYVALRKRVLGVDSLRMYDVYAPLVPSHDRRYSFDEAMDVVREGLMCLGPRYQELLNKAVSERWIDVEETPGKTSGAFSLGIYGVHPYVLLNHRGDLDSVFTIAHELGHAMHSYFSNLNQPEAKADYSIFVAEVASTVNEVLLTLYLLDTAKNRDERLVVLNHYLDEFRTTVVRQTMFAEFEKMAHDDFENGVPVTFESLSQMYGTLNAQYYGPDMQPDDRIMYEWARIPHFYNAFYVYKYATGFSCAVKIASDIANGKAGAVDNYMRFLSSGGSNYPLELLKIAGVDLVEGEPIRECMRAFDSTLKEFSSLLERDQN